MIIFSFQPLAIIEAVRNRTAGIQHFGAARQAAGNRTFSDAVFLLL